MIQAAISAKSCHNLMGGIWAACNGWPLRWRMVRITTGISKAAQKKHAGSAQNIGRQIGAGLGKKRKETGYHQVKPAENKHYNAAKAENQ